MVQSVDIQNGIKGTGGLGAILDGFMWESGCHKTQHRVITECIIIDQKGDMMVYSACSNKQLTVLLISF